MLASGSMAFYHWTIRVPPLFNNVYYKFNITACKLHLSRKQLTARNRHSSQKHERFRNLNNSMLQLPHNLAHYIECRKDEAQRSIIIQVASYKSNKEVVSYCSQFGDIANMFSYNIPKDHYFILVEYKRIKSTMKALDSATYVDTENIIPGRTNVLWFRQTGHNVNYKEKTVTIPSILYPNDFMSRETSVKNALLQASTLSSQIMLLYNAYKLSELEIRLKFQVIISLEQYFSGIFPNIIVYPFGSFINGFGKKFSDLDLVLFANSNQQEKEWSKLIFHAKAVNANEKQQAQEFMGVLADTMKYMVPGISHVRRILNARVPIIKFKNVYMHTECDLSINNVVATRMTEVLYLYGNINSTVRPLIFAIRKWAQENKLTSLHPGRTITNFSLTLLAIFFLQQQQIIPSINQIDGFKETSTSLGNSLNHIYVQKLYQNLTNSLMNEPLSCLLLKFFKYYATFNFNENGICLRKGCILENSRHVPLYINNPFQQELNVSKNVSQFEIDRLQSLMVIAVTNLESSEPSTSNNWGLLSIFGNDECINTDTNVSKLSTETNSTLKDEEIAENSDTTKSTQESNIDNALNVQQDAN